MFGYVFSLARLGLEGYGLLIVIRALISWVSPDPFNPIVRFLYRATEPVLRPIRRRLPDLGGLDISPVVALAAIYILEIVLSRLAFELG